MPIEPEPFTTDPPGLAGPPWFHNRWETLTFLHWAYSPDQVQRLLPRGLTVDTVDGRAWVALVPFLMAGVRPPVVPAIPWFSTFCETNVRTYVHDERGRRGVYFFSLDASRLGVVLGARGAYGVPYVWSRMRMERTGDVISYTARRRWPGPRGARSLVKVRVGDVLPGAEDEPLLQFLTARWSTLSGPHWSHRRSPIGWTPVTHPRWVLRAAELLSVDDELVAATGLPQPVGRPLVHHADLAVAEIGRPGH